jgi:hypothetical protein
MINNFAPYLIEVKEQVYSLSQEELDFLQSEYIRLKTLIDSGEYELTIEDQKVILQWRRADREIKFILNKAKPVKEKTIRVKKPKKLSQKVLGLLYIKELQEEVLTAEEERNRTFTLTGEIT